jgi:hypothetical protein
MFNKKSPRPQVRFMFDGVVYQWHGWLGCQLKSYEWRTLPAGTERKLDFCDSRNPPVTMTIYRTKRKGLKVETTWSVDKSGTYDQYCERINSLRERLKKLV